LSLPDIVFTPQRNCLDTKKYACATYNQKNEGAQMVRGVFGSQGSSIQNKLREKNPYGFLSRNRASRCSWNLKAGEHSKNKYPFFPETFPLKLRHFSQ
jgi:hypothetical protein